MWIKKGTAVVACTLCLALIANAGNVTNDRSLGSAAVGHFGNVFTIYQGCGQRAGGNLFQSLSTLNLDPGETADFTGPSSGVSNVITRVTGGPSTINGTLECDIPNANFYLINSSGIVFGPGASLNVKGSFAVATADVVHLADGGRFPASLGATPLLTVASPSAFGFLSPQPKPVTVTGATLAVSAGQSLTIASGPVTMSGSAINAPGGTISVAAVAAQGTTLLSGQSIIAPATFAAFAPIQMTNSGISLTGTGGGQAIVQGGAMTMSNSTIRANTTDSNGGDIAVFAATLNIVGGSEIESSTFGSGNASNISVTVVGQATFDGTSQPFGTTGIFSEGTSVASGNSGDISVSAGSISVINGAEISNATFGAGNAGTVTVSAGALSILNTAEIESNTSGSGNAGQIAVTVSGLATLNDDGQATVGSGIFTDSARHATGNAGEVEVSAGSLSIIAGANIASSTLSAGQGGDVRVRVAGTATIDAMGVTTIFGTGIFSESYSGAAGKSGDLKVVAGNLSVLNGAQISAETLGTDDAGTVTVSTGGLVTLDGGGTSLNTTGIFSQSSTITAGNAGEVMLSARTLNVLDGAEISTSTSGTGNAGTVIVSAGRLNILNTAEIESDTSGSGNAGQITVTATGLATLNDDGQAKFGTGVFTDSARHATGNAGTVIATFQSLNVFAGANIASSTFSAGKGGDVRVTVAGTATLDAMGVTTIFGTGIFSESYSGAAGNSGDLKVVAGRLSVLNGAQISAETLGTGDAGTVKVFAGGLSVLNTADIESSTSGSGNAGDVIVTVTGLATLDGAGSSFGATGIFSQSSTATAGNAEEVTLSARTLNVLNGAEISTSTSGKGNAGTVTVSAEGLSILNTAEIESSTSGSGNAGQINVAVNGVATFNDMGQSNFGTGIFTDCAAQATGNAGTVNFSAGSLNILEGANIASSTFGGGNGGDVFVTVTGPAVFDAMGITTMFGTGIFCVAYAGANGGAGNINLSVGSLGILNGAEISVASTGTNGGTVNIASGGNIVLFNSSISGHAKDNGGSVTISLPQTISLTGSTIRTSAGDMGGDITIDLTGDPTNDPTIFVVNNSRINAAGAVRTDNGSLTVNADTFLVSSDSSVTATGFIETPPPEVGIASAIIVGKPITPSTNDGLTPSCAEMVNSDYSSFIKTGRGGLPIEPGGWIPVVPEDDGN